MPDILFVNCVEPDKTIVKIPIGIANLFSYAREHGYDPMMFDCQVLSGCTQQEIAHELNSVVLEYKPLIIGFSFMTPNYEFTKYLIQSLSIVKSEAVLIAGGCHPTALPRETLNEFSEIDAVIAGEGELALISILKDIKTNKRITKVHPSTISKNFNDKLFFKVVENLNELPFPSYDCFLEYTEHITKSFRYHSSRGCSGSCTYCFIKEMSMPGIRKRSPDVIINDLHILKTKFSAKHIHFGDSLFGESKDDAEEVCQKIITQRLDVTWSCQTKLDFLNSNMLNIMKASGCNEVWVGIESIDNNIRGSIYSKTSDISNLKAIVQECNSIGINIHLNIILGPFDTISSLKKLKTLADKIHPAFISIQMLQVFPKTHISTILKKRGLLIANPNYEWKWKCQDKRMTKILDLINIYEREGAQKLENSFIEIETNSRFRKKFIKKYLEYQSNYLGQLIDGNLIFNDNLLKLFN